jgi:hypothetical protein
MEKKLKRRQGAKVKGEDQEERSQEDKSDKPHDLGNYSSKPKLFC